MARLCSTKTDPTESKAKPNHGGGLIDLRGVGPTLAKNLGNSPESATAGRTRSAKKRLVFSFKTNVSTALNWSPKNSRISPIKNQLLRLISIMTPAKSFAFLAIDLNGWRTSDHCRDDALCGWRNGEPGERRIGLEGVLPNVADVVAVGIGRFAANFKRIPTQNKALPAI